MARPIKGVFTILYENDWHIANLVEDSPIYKNCIYSDGDVSEAITKTSTSNLDCAILEVYKNGELHFLYKPSDYSYIKEWVNMNSIEVNPQEFYDEFIRISNKKYPEF